MNTHPCSVPGCGRDVPSHLLMCLPHWRQVPCVLQAAVYAAFRKWRKGLIPVEDLRAVQDRAIAAASEAPAAVKGGT